MSLVLCFSGCQKETTVCFVLCLIGWADCECGCKVGERPTAFLMDTPGVMLPDVPNEEIGMRLALTGMYTSLLLYCCFLDKMHLSSTGTCTFPLPQGQACILVGDL